MVQRPATAIPRETSSTPPAGNGTSEGTLNQRVRGLRLPDESQMRSRSNVHRIVWMLSILVIIVGIGYWASTRGWFSEVVAIGNKDTKVGTESTTTKTNTTQTRDAAQSGGNSSAPSPSAISTSPPPASSIPVAKMGDVTLQQKGYVRPTHQLLVSPLVSGRIATLDIEEGRRVKKGDVLATLESVEYEADVARDRALLESARRRLEELERGNRPEEIDAAKHDVAETQAQRQHLYTDWKRKIQLRAKNVSTEDELEKAESDFKAMDERVNRLQAEYKMMVDGPRRERIAIAKAEVTGAEAELKRAEWRLSNCTIRAPISGTILKKNAEEGNIVNPIAFNGSFSLCEMADLSDLEVELSVQERDVSRVSKGQKCKVRPEAYPERVYDGIVSRLMPIADRAKGAVPVRVKLIVPAEEEGVYLKPEMGAIVDFLKN